VEPRGDSGVLLHPAQSSLHRNYALGQLSETDLMSAVMLISILSNITVMHCDLAAAEVVTAVHSQGGISPARSFTTNDDDLEIRSRSSKMQSDVPSCCLINKPKRNNLISKVAYN
jgi:hypothetical protein